MSVPMDAGRRKVLSWGVVPNRFRRRHRHNFAEFEGCLCSGIADIVPALVR